MKLTWQQQVCDDGVHEGYIPLQWLKHHDYSDHQLDKRRKQSQPTSAAMVWHCSILSTTPGWAQGDSKFLTAGTTMGLIHSYEK